MTRPLTSGLPLGLAVVFGVTIAYVGSQPHFDDTGIQAGLLVLSAGVLGLMGPERPWLWALGVGVWTPIAGWIVNNPPDPRSKPLAGAYAGMLFRRVLSATE